MKDIKKIIREVLNQINEKEDRCKRIADRKYDKPSAYKSGAIVRCRKGDIWKDLKEAKQVGPLYHYTSADGLKGIIQSNRINASEENYLGNELYYISFTRNKNFHKKGSKFSVKTEYRITLDGDKLSSKYKIRPFAYIPGWDIEDSWELDWLDDEPENVRRDFFNATGDYDEQEERIFFKNENGGINDIKNYILAIDKVEDIQEEDLNHLNEKKETLRTWFKRKGAPGKEGGWVDCNAPIRKDGKITGYKTCGRKEGEKRAKYPSCRPTPAQCKSPGKGKKWGKTK